MSSYVCILICSYLFYQAFWRSKRSPFRPPEMDANSLIVGVEEMKVRHFSGRIVWQPNQLDLHAGAIKINTHPGKLTKIRFQGTFESMIFQTSPGGICENSLGGLLGNLHIHPSKLSKIWVAFYHLKDESFSKLCLQRSHSGFLTKLQHWKLDISSNHFFTCIDLGDAQLSERTCDLSTSNAFQLWASGNFRKFLAHSSWLFQIYLGEIFIYN